MAYGVKYRVEYKDTAGVNKKHDIEVLDYTGAVIDCAACEDPFNIELPAPSPIIQMPVHSMGATLNLESATNLMFKSLYSINPQRVRLRSYAGASSVPYFTGYLNTEVFGEPYAYLTDYDVSLYFNDGFATLERYKYVDGTGFNYTGSSIFWTVLTRIITRLNLPFEYLYFACRHSEDSITVGAAETLFHHLSADQANYYDENDEPMKHFQVLEAILAPFGLQIRWYCGSILICEPQMLADASFSVKRFNGSFAYVDTVTISHNYDISNDDINWYADDQNLDMVSGFSRQKIRYSPFINEGAVKDVDLTNRYLWSGTEIWTADTYGVFRLTGITAIAGITFDITYVQFTGRKRETFDKGEIYFEKMVMGYDPLFLSVAGYRVAGVTGQFLKIKGEVFIRSKWDEYNNSVVSVVASRIEIPVNLEIDGKGMHWNPALGTAGEWEFISGYDGAVDFKAFVYKTQEEATICDRWVEFSTYVPWNFPGGDAVLKIWDPEVFTYATGGVKLGWGGGLKMYRYRNLTVQAFEGGTFLNTGGVEGTSDAVEVSEEDVSYKGEINEEFINEAPEITLLHADARNITDRAAICKSDKNYTTQWRKTGYTSSYRLVDLLLRAIHSQYQDSLIQLSGTIEADELMLANGGPTFLFTLQDTDNLGAAKFLFTGGIYNDFKRSLNGTFLEIKQEDMTLNIV